MFFNYSSKNEIGYITLKSVPGNPIPNPSLTDKEELRAFLNQKEIKAVIIIGEGRHFSSGANMETFDELISDPNDFINGLNYGKDVLEIIRNAPVPTVAVIKGACLGGGLEIALSATFRFVTKNSIIGFPESGLGLMPGLGGTVVKEIPRSVLAKMVLSAETLNGEEAVELGLAEDSFKPQEILLEAEQFIKLLIKDRTKEQINSIMSSISNSYNLDRDEALHKETEMFVALASKLEN